MDVRVPLGVHDLGDVGVRRDPGVVVDLGVQVRPGFPPQLEQQLGSAVVSQAAGTEVVDVDVQVPLEVPADRGAVLLYEGEEPEDSPSGISIAFWNSVNTARCRRRRSMTPIRS